MGDLKKDMSVIVADIKDDVLLGMDIGEEIDILTSRHQVVINGVTIPCIHVRPNRVLKVVLADDYIIPSFSEMILRVYVQREDGSHERTGEVLIEPLQAFEERYSLITARSLVDLKTDVTGKVRALNPNSHPVKVRQDSVVACAEFLSEDVERCIVAEIPYPADFLQGVENFELHHSGNERMTRDHSVEVFDSHKGCESMARGHECSSNVGNGIMHLRQSNETLSGQSEEGLSSCQGHENSSIEDSGNGHQENGSHLPEYLKNLALRATEGKSPPQQRQIEELLIKHKTAFSKDEHDLGLTHIVSHAIDTGDARPVKQAPRRVPMSLVNEEIKAIENLKKQGVIRESSSPWASPIVLVRKKNGKIRTCIDFRILNKSTIKDAYPLPRTQDCIDAVAGSMFFSTLDMTSGYNQVPIREEDIPKTAFVSHHGFWEWTTMPFGLTNGPATFQRLMELALTGLQWTSCLIYLDDVIIFGKTFEDHLQRLDAVLDRVRIANLKLKVEKCVLFEEEVEFLGHVVNRDGVKPNPNNTAKIAQWKIPETVTQVRQFLGLCSYYRRFVKGFATIAKPLTELTQKNATLVWTEDCQKAFDNLKQQLLGKNITAYPQEKGEYILDTDASDFGIGAVLSQIQNGRERVIAYASRSLNKAERNYCVTDRELLAVRYFTDYFRHYLLGRHFLVRTDHQAIRWLFSLKQPKGRVARWIEILSTYDFSVEYRPGKKHGNADGLSRCINPKDCQCSEQDNEEDLKCGPCNKCKRRASETENTNPRPNEQILRQVKLYSQTCWSKLIQLILQFIIWITSCVTGNYETRIESTLDRGSLASTTEVTHRIAALREPWFQGFTNRELHNSQEQDPAVNQLLQ